MLRLYIDDNDDNTLALISIIIQYLFTYQYRNCRSSCSIHMISVTIEFTSYLYRLDYTVAHYGILTTEVKLDATLCFVCDDNDMKKKKEMDDNKNKKKKKKIDKKQIEMNGDDSDDDDEEEEEEDDYADVWDSGDVGGFECKLVILILILFICIGFMTTIIIIIILIIISI